MLRWFRAQVVPGALVVAPLLIILAFDLIPDADCPSAPDRYDLVAFQPVRHRPGGEDSLIFIVRHCPRDSTRIFRTPTRQCALSTQIPSGTFRAMVAEQDTLYLFRPSGRIILPLPYPNRFPIELRPDERRTDAPG